MTADGSMVLRLVDRPLPGARHHVVVSVRGPGIVPREAGVEVDVAIDAGLAERLRSYLEDYGEFPDPAADAVAADTEQDISRLGREMFTAVFGAGDAAMIWAQARLAGLHRVRVEIDADPADVPGLPWELLRDPAAGRALVLNAAQFVRTHLQASTGRLPDAHGDGLRVLLVICRPDGDQDVAFRSVASRLVRGGADRIDGLELDVLRPPTFRRLGEVLRAACDRGRPYDVVHFDGHGTYLDVTELAESPSGGGGGVAVSPVRYGINLAGPARKGRHGYLLFEDPTAPSNQQLVDGQALATQLVDNQVPVVVLNACRSAYADTPDDDGPERDAQGVHDRIRAYGSLAAEVADAGVPGVVAMRYNVYVVTAAQFVADLYTHLAAATSLGAAATAARKALADDPTRQIGTTPVALQDWMVPTVYEALPLTLLTPRPDGSSAPRITLAADGSTHASGAGVPGAPDVGFFGRDETLLALDRAFDTHQIVLLHAYAGAGKTTTAAEFARWYTTTGALDTVLWTSFGHHTPLDRVLDTVGTHFAALLEANDIHWSAVTDPAQRRDYALQVLAQIPVLWIWDNVEPVAGFPHNTPSAWTDTEQHDLAVFLRELTTGTRAKVLLTSRRTETDSTWLGELPVRVRLPAMPMRERLQLTHALLGRLTPHTAPGPREDIDWRPLLRFTGGNPLTITVTVRQAVRAGAVTTAQIAGFVQQVQAGEAALEDTRDATQGRDRSLAASLDYGFTHAFTPTEQAQLAVLHLFRDTVDIDALRAMGHPDWAGDDAIPVLAGADRDSLDALLDRAAEIGLLTGYGGGYYGIHPALPWYFTTLFGHHHGPPHSSAAAAAERAYLHAHAAVGNYSALQVENGRADLVLPALRAEEHNLLHALHLARTHHLPGADGAGGCLQGLSQLYDLTGRDPEWARIITDVEGDYIDPVTDQPLPGCDPDDYRIITEYRVRIARDQRDWPTATRLHTNRIAVDRERAAPHLNIPTDQLDSIGRLRIRSLAVSEQLLGQLLGEQDDPGCVQHYRAAYTLGEQIGDTTVPANCACNLGNAYLSVPGLRDLDQAQHWHQRHLDLTPADNRVGRAGAHGSLATVAYERFRDARRAGKPDTELRAFLESARAGHHQVLDLLPPDHHDYRATAHNQLGVLYREVGDVPQAMHHYTRAIHHKEARGDTYGAGQTRYNIALLLQSADRAGDALHYARAAHTNFLTVGPGAAAEAALAADLIHDLERALPT